LQPARENNHKTAMRKCENANLRCECENAKKRSIDAMRCDHFEEFSECDANAKIDSHYQPCYEVLDSWLLGQVTPSPDARSAKWQMFAKEKLVDFCWCGPCQLELFFFLFCQILIVNLLFIFYLRAITLTAQSSSIWSSTYPRRATITQTNKTTAMKRQKGAPCGLRPSIIPQEYGFAKRARCTCRFFPLPFSKRFDSNLVPTLHELQLTYTAATRYSHQESE
jgi:hypothetical protein